MSINQELLDMVIQYRDLLEQIDLNKKLQSAVNSALGNTGEPIWPAFEGDLVTCQRLIEAAEPKLARK